MFSTSRDFGNVNTVKTRLVLLIRVGKSIMHAQLSSGFRCQTFALNLPTAKSIHCVCEQGMVLQDYMYMDALAWFNLHWIPSRKVQKSV